LECGKVELETAIRCVKSASNSTGRQAGTRRFTYPNQVAGTQVEAAEWQTVKETTAVC
jgi:hypothetical protein